MPAPRVACSARRSAARVRRTSAEAQPFFSRRMPPSMPALRPFSHRPPSEIGVSFCLNSVLYDRTGVFFGSSIALPLFFVLRESLERTVMFGVLALADDFGGPRQPGFITGHFLPGDDGD